MNRTLYSYLFLIFLDNSRDTVQEWDMKMQNNG